MRYSDVIKALKDQAIDFIVAGGHALTFHGVDTINTTLHLLVNLKRKNMEKLVDTLAGLGYSPVVPAHADHILNATSRGQLVKDRRSDTVTFYNTKENGLVDVCLRDEMDYKTIKQGSVTYAKAGMRIPVVSAAHLLEMKMRSGKWRDIRDARRLGEKLEGKIVMAN